MDAELQLHEATFRSFGSTCRIVSDVESSVLAGVHRLEDLEARWSRFVPTSEVSLLNRSRTWSPVSEVTRLLIDRACEASRRTAGRMNPLLLDRLIELGYDRSHEHLAAVSRAVANDTSHRGAARSWSAPDAGTIEVDGGAIRLPHGATFDPGGVGKGLAADLVMEDLLDAGATWALVSLGGDLRFGGGELESLGWVANIEDPRQSEVVSASVRVFTGALATSSRLSRRWLHEGSTEHHLLDPATGAPAVSRRIAATVHANVAWWADVVAKVLVIDDRVGRPELDDWAATALVFDAHGGAEVLGMPVQQLDEVVS